MKRALIKMAVVVALVGGLGWLFVRSARNVRSEPYQIGRGQLAGWTLAIDPAPSASGVLLGLQPDKQTAAMLFSQVFSRSGESLSGPVPAAIPLVLQSEFSPGQSGTFTAEALLSAARTAGLDSSQLQPRCMAQRRTSEPGITRQVYFVRFDWPAFNSFRAQVAERMRASGGTGIDPGALSPVLIVAGSDSAFGRWLPLNAENANDCLAPIAIN